MTSQLAKAVFVVGLLMMAGTGTAIAQSQDATGAADHHPEASAGAGSSASSDDIGRGSNGPMSGEGSMMMSPEMMQMMGPQMMQMMMRMMNGGGMPGMMSGNAMPMGGMMGACDTHGMAGTGHRMDGMLYGMPEDDQIEMTPERVREFVQRRLAWHGNPRLKIGEIATSSDGRITAEIVTVDGSLVQKLAFNRYPGLFRVLTE
jgi:hypothetical protein